VKEGPEKRGEKEEIGPLAAVGKRRGRTCGRGRSRGNLVRHREPGRGRKGPRTRREEINHLIIRTKSSHEGRALSRIGKTNYLSPIRKKRKGEKRGKEAPENERRKGGVRKPKKRNIKLRPPEARPPTGKGVDENI